MVKANKFNIEFKLPVELYDKLDCHERVVENKFDTFVCSSKKYPDFALLEIFPDNLVSNMDKFIDFMTKETIEANKKHHDGEFTLKELYAGKTKVGDKELYEFSHCGEESVMNYFIVDDNVVFVGLYQAILKSFDRDKKIYYEIIKSFKEVD